MVAAELYAAGDISPRMEEYMEDLSKAPGFPLIGQEISVDSVIRAFIWDIGRGFHKGDPQDYPERPNPHLCKRYFTR